MQIGQWFATSAIVLRWTGLALAALALWCLLAAINARREAVLDSIEKRAHDYAEKRMTWRNKAAFNRRIGRRIRWLRFRRWLRTPQRGRLGPQLARPVTVLAVFLGTLGGLHVAGVTGHQWVATLNGLITPGQAQGSWQVALALVGAPVAFVLWLFRDIHAARTLENQRKDLNLKEFQEIQMRAAGALDEKLPAVARETLQIAAIHQLRPFLTGEYGESFRRPAWEFFRARLRASTEATGEAAITDWVAAGGFPKVAGEGAGERAKRIREEIYKNLNKLQPGPVTQAVRAVVREEARTIFGGARVGRPDLCINTRFDGIDLSRQILAGEAFTRSYFAGADLRRVHLEGANLGGAHLEGADLNDAHLEGAVLWGAHLESADLSGAHLEGANLRRAHLGGAGLIGAHLEGANLSWAQLEGADLSGAHLEGADLSGAHLEGAGLSSAHLEGANLFGAPLEGADLIDAHLEGANLSNAIFDDATILLSRQTDARPEALAAAQQRLRDLGARHVNDRP